MAHPASVVEPPPRLGKLTLREELSSSFFGARHRARVANSGRSGTHALGTVERQSLAPSGELRAVRVVRADASDVIERLAAAATAVRAATHPALMTPLQIVREGARLGVATRDQSGITLAVLEAHNATRKEGLPQPIALRIALDVVEGLSALEAALPSDESRTCLYGGLTPDSIHVGHDGQTRLSDPGVMAAAARERVWADEPSLLAYAAPELHAPVGRHVRHDARTDTFAIGVMLWELLSCRALFLAPSAHETIEAVCHARIPRVRRERFVRGEPIMATVANVVARALERDPARRYQSYDELASALREAAPAASRDEVAACVASAVQVQAVPQPAFEEHERESTEETLEVPVAAALMALSAGEKAVAKRSKRLQHAALALAALVIVALATWALLREPPHGPPARVEPAPRAVVPEPAAPPSSPAAEPRVVPEAAQPEAMPATAEPAPESKPAPTRAVKPAATRRKPALRRQAPAKRPFIPDDI